MSTVEKIKKGKKLIEELTNILSELSDKELIDLFKDGEMDLFLKSILDPSEVINYPIILQNFF